MAIVCKSPAEIALMQRANDITIEAYRAAFATLAALLSWVAVASGDGGIGTPENLLRRRPDVQVAVDEPGHQRPPAEVHAAGRCGGDGLIGDLGDDAVLHQHMPVHRVVGGAVQDAGVGEQRDGHG